MFANTPSIPWVGDTGRIFYAGDSLVEQCGKDFGMGSRAHGFIGWPGANSSQMRERLSLGVEGWPYTTEINNIEERKRFYEAGALVLGLGTNDCWTYISDETWVDNIQWFMAQANGRPVCWFDIKQSPALQGRADQLSWYLYAFTDRYPNLKILGWKQWCEENPNALLDDGVHIATYEYGCLGGRLKLLQHGVPDAPEAVSEKGYWYPHRSLAGHPIFLSGWGASAGTRTETIEVNLRVDWQHVLRWPVDKATTDVFARAASGKGWDFWIPGDHMGKLAAVDLVDKEGNFHSLGTRVL